MVCELVDGDSVSLGSVRAGVVWRSGSAVSEDPVPSCLDGLLLRSGLEYGETWDVVTSFRCGLDWGDAWTGAARRGDWYCWPARELSTAPLLERCRRVLLSEARLEDVE